MIPDLEKAISMAINTGKVKIGYKTVHRSILNGKVIVTIISNNIPAHSKTKLLRDCELSKIPVIEYEKSGNDLGAICGKPHRISAMAIFDPGNSKILQFI